MLAFKARPRPPKLTKREREVASLVQKGFKNQEIATELQISSETVKAHLKNIFRKLGIDSRTKLVILLQRSG